MRDLLEKYSSSLIACSQTQVNSKYGETVEDMNMGFLTEVLDPILSVFNCSSVI
jgi:hypothetical protein